MLNAVILLMTLSIMVQQEFYTIKGCVITVYRDGVAHVYIEAYVDEMEPYIVLPLLSSIEKISNIIVLDESNEVLDYDYGENNTIIIYSLGAKQVKLEYETTGLTSMEYGLWTIRVPAPFNMVIRLPEDAVIISINAAPEEIKAVDRRIEVTLTPGEWEISYELPIAPPTRPTTPPTTPGQPPTTPTTASYINIVIYIVVGVCVLCAAIIAALYARRRWRARGLSGEEMEVVKFIRERGGRALEAELRERFPHIPRTSMWRMIRRLEKRGIVKVKKVGLQNVVELE
ncbi:MAG: hypothetical protein QW186_06455 [Candidatus Bathyarchaeia archaeon]